MSSSHLNLNGDQKQSRQFNSLVAITEETADSVDNLIHKHIPTDGSKCQRVSESSVT